VRALEIVVENADLFDVKADAVVFKHAGGFHGADAVAAKRLERAGHDRLVFEPKRGETVIVASGKAFAAESALFLGTERPTAPWSTAPFASSSSVSVVSWPTWSDSPSTPTPGYQLASPLGVA